MSIIGRNDYCPCGSGKKYKKCCLIYESNSLMLWKKNYDIISNKIQQSENVKIILFSILKIIQKEKWEGACHATSSVMYVLLNELGMKPQIYMGEVQYGNYIFDHSWIEIECKIYDVAISMGLEGMSISAPIIAGYNISTFKKTEGTYGVEMGEGLGFPAKHIKNLSITEYMDNFPFYDEGIWKIVYDIGIELKIYFDLDILREKYSSASWKLK